ncbi:MAG: DNA polymerase III subunit delta [Anaerolineae bacterium]|nr:DNA polymerase III subunit delta [Anaerolineae bacterium]
MSRKAPTFYVFHGEDEYSIKAQVNEMRQQMGDDLNISEYEGSRIAVADVLASARVMPFLSDRRLLLVTGMLTYLTRKGASKDSKDQLARLVAELPTLPESSRVVFIEYQTLSDKHPVLGLIGQDPSGYVKVFNPPKNPVVWINKQAQAYDVMIEPRAAAALAQVIGEDLRALDNEIVKLASYVGRKGFITEKEIALLTPYVAQVDVFEMVDALGQRNAQKTTALLHQLLAESDALQLFGMIIRQFRLLIQTRDLLDNGTAIKDLPKFLGLPGFVAEKLARQARTFGSIDQLEQIYRHLLETDVAIKTSKVEDVLALDLLVAGLAG